MRIYKVLLLNILFVITFHNSYSQIDSLKAKIESYTASKHTKIGVGVLALERGDTLLIANDHHYPMQSVYKFHLALAVLHQVDEGKLTLTKEIYITKKDLHPNTWSPLQKKYPKGNIRLPLSEIINYMISQSDNNACDILFKLVPPKEVEQYIKQIGINDISIKATENDMHSEDWNVQYTNWTTPMAAVILLQKFYTGNILSKTSFDFLLDAMINSSNAANRIKSGLPDGTILAHKTGTSGREDDTNMQAAMNDIGIVTLPNGKHIAIAVFVSDSKEDDDTNAKIIADISKLVFEYFTTHS